MDSSLRIIKGLTDKSAYPHDVSSITLIETHISWVLLTGPFAYKIKKPVDFGFLDFSTLEKRHLFCQEELRLNRRFSENLYLDVVPITGTPDRPILSGEGEAIEYAVKMKQFPPNSLLAWVAESGKLNNETIDQIAAIVANFHERAGHADAKSSYGNCEDIKKWFDENFEHIRPLLSDDLCLAQLRALEIWGDAQLQNLSGLMHQRKLKGFVRECHGDLHLGNMTMLDGKVILFDCIEFNPMLRWIDVISEVAFLFIDLCHFGYEKLAYRLLNHYLSASADYQGLAMLRFYLVYRALVRAKVTLLKREQMRNDGPAVQKAWLEYLGYSLLAERFRPKQPALLIITFGFSGSGKSTLSGQLAGQIGAIHIRSDIERKRLFAYRAGQQSGSGLGAGLYTADASRLTYQRLAELASTIIEAGFPVIVDAAFLKLEQREIFQKLARSIGANFTILSVQAPETVLIERIRQRRHSGSDPSEATVDVLRHQLQTVEALSDKELGAVIRINTEIGPIDEALLNELSEGIKKLGQTAALQ